MKIQPHKVCPLCGEGLVNSKFIRRDCPAIKKKNFSFVESRCNIYHSDDSSHIFFQIISLYGDMYCESISFPFKRIQVSIDYVNHITSLMYTKKSINFKPIPPDIIDLKDTIIDIDYLNIDRTIKKVMNYRVFI